MEWCFRVCHRLSVATAGRTDLERLCGYVMRPPLATGRLRYFDPDHLTLALKTPTLGTTAPVPADLAPAVSFGAAGECDPWVEVVSFIGALRQVAGATGDIR